MPIFVYRNNQNGATAEVLQKTESFVYKHSTEVPADIVLKHDDGFFEPGDIEREPTAPGGFQGLPTPKFGREK